MVVHLKNQIALAGRKMLQQFQAVGRVAHHQIFVLLQAIHQDVVAATALLIQHQTVAHRAFGHAQNSTRADAIQKSARVPAGEFDAAHVAHIKEAGGRASPSMFIKNGSKMQGHVPACEVRHLGVVLQVHRVKRGF